MSRSMTFSLLLLLTMSCSVARSSSPWGSVRLRRITPVGEPDHDPNTPTPAIQARPYAVGWRRAMFVDRSRTIPGSHTDSGEPGPRVLATGGLGPGQRSGERSRPTRRVLRSIHRRPIPPRPVRARVRPRSIELRAAARRVGTSGVRRRFSVVPAHEPGGRGRPLSQGDIVHQPGDLSLPERPELARATRASHGAFVGSIDPTRVAVAGHSDGADTALVAAGTGAAARMPASSR